MNHDVDRRLHHRIDRARVDGGKGPMEQQGQSPERVASVVGVDGGQ